jgi:predicted transcriptional regulator
LSIKPEFASAILSGTKRFEYRRTIFRREDIDTVVLYASSPTQRVVGEFTIKRVISAPPMELWASTHAWSGISRAYFNDYFRGCQVAHAIEVGKVKEYKLPKLLTASLSVSRAPQSFCYV